MSWIHQLSLHRFNGCIDGQALQIQTVEKISGLKARGMSHMSLDGLNLDSRWQFRKTGATPNGRVVVVVDGCCWLQLQVAPRRRRRRKLTSSCCSSCSWCDDGQTLEIRLLGSSHDTSNVRGQLGRGHGMRVVQIMVMITLMIIMIPHKWRSRNKRIMNRMGVIVMGGQSFHDNDW